MATPDETEWMAIMIEIVAVVSAVVFALVQSS